MSELLKITLQYIIPALIAVAGIYINTSKKKQNLSSETVEETVNADGSKHTKRITKYK